MQLAHVLRDPLGDVALGLQRFHRAPRLLQQMLEPRQLDEHVIDHRLLLADALERDLHVAEHVDDGVGLALHIVDELAAALDRGDAVVGAGEAVAEAISSLFACAISARRSAIAASSAWL